MIIVIESAILECTSLLSLATFTMVVTLADASDVMKEAIICGYIIGKRRQFLAIPLSICVHKFLTTRQHFCQPNQ